MNVELLYPSLDNGESAGSPFEKCIAGIVRDAAVEMACPYLGLEILQQITASAESWRLVTDIQEWIRAQPASKHAEILHFVQQNREQIRDCRDIHAKTVVTGDHALVGSANFTKTGFEDNLEVGVLFHQTQHVTELQAWFQELWDQTDLVNEKRAIEYVDRLKSNDEGGETPSMPATGPEINTSLDHLARETLPVDEADHEELVTRIEMAPNRQWITSYLDWVAGLLDAKNLEDDNPHLALTIPASQRQPLPVNVNQRYVLAAYPDEDLVGLMLPSDSIAVDTLSEYIGDFGRFSTPSGEDPYWFEFPGGLDPYVTDEIKRDWKRAVEAELKRAKRSGYRDKHRSAVYKAATDSVYRNRVLRDAFG